MCLSKMKLPKCFKYYTHNADSNKQLMAKRNTGDTELNTYTTPETTVN